MTIFIGDSGGPDILQRRRVERKTRNKRTVAGRRKTTRADKRHSRRSSCDMMRYDPKQPSSWRTVRVITGASVPNGSRDNGRPAVRSFGGGARKTLFRMRLESYETHRFVTEIDVSFDPMGPRGRTDGGCEGGISLLFSTKEKKQKNANVRRRYVLDRAIIFTYS